MFLDFNRPLIFVAHPDDETLSCAGLLQRVGASTVVFATDGAPPYHGFEHQFGTLRNYSKARFEEAALALAGIPNCSFQRLTKPDGSFLVDQHLFHDLRAAFDSLCRVARAFSPDALLTHAYEGGHIDHDACSFIVSHAAGALSLRRFEFPLYSTNENGKGTFQQFRDPGASLIECRLSPAETARKRAALAAYKSQPGLASFFDLSTERIRPATRTDYSIAMCPHYSCRNRSALFLRKRLNSRVLLKQFAKFEAR